MALFDIKKIKDSVGKSAEGIKKSISDGNMIMLIISTPNLTIMIGEMKILMTRPLLIRKK